EGSTSTSPSAGVIQIAVIRLPRIANFDDFDPLRREPGVHVRYVDSPTQLGRPHAVILPGTKSTIADLHWLQIRGLADAIVRLAQEGVGIVGLCGGYQMLGKAIHDPDQVESDMSDMAGLGLLPLETTFVPGKATHQVRATVVGGPGWLVKLTGQVVTGYEIHLGRTAPAAAWLQIVERGGATCAVPDGAVSAGGRVWGCDRAGLFANDTFRRAWLQSLQAEFRSSPLPEAIQLQSSLDRLADAIAAAIPVARLHQIIYEGVSP